MYMGYWNEAGGKPGRITRAVEEEYYAKFLKREPGYYDDAEWWKPALLALDGIVVISLLA